MERVYLVAWRREAVLEHRTHIARNLSRDLLRGEIIRLSIFREGSADEDRSAYMSIEHCVVFLSCEEFKLTRVMQDLLPLSMASGASEHQV